MNTTMHRANVPPPDDVHAELDAPVTSGNPTTTGPTTTSPTTTGQENIGQTKVGLSSATQTFETIVFTLAVQIVLAAGPILVVWWVVQAWSRRNDLFLDFVTAVITATSIGAWMRVTRPDAPIRRFALVPAAVQNSARHLVERSAFGVGRLTGWTSVEPDHGLSLLRSPQSLDELRLDGVLEAGPGERVRRRVSERTRDVVVAEAIKPSHPAPREDPRHQTVEHVVTRGESFWSLAEQRLGDGRRWTEIRDLNANREVAPGVVLSERDAPQVGHRILVPDSTPPTA